MTASYQYPAPYASSSRGKMPSQQDAARQTQSPAIPAVFPELEALSVNQLEKLVTDRATLKAYIKNMDNVVNFMKLYDDLVKGNKDLAAADEADEASEDIAARFTNGDIDVNQFVAEFLPMRKLYHLRTTKVDRFSKP
ncbi:hypothetical protein DYB32_006089 [Aphanomyces invadans]|uniref:VPS37 C-terminal domain-containing protein n=1 Tax=Aphanomyces invadans TaxID=157072 RepID=A0A418AVB1_9STRA|nr:hypothetical protein DYB32_006089 [Aphanomyces invadans]